MDCFIKFKVVYNLMLNGNAEDNLGNNFQILDVNDDGSISLEEMIVLVKNILVMNENQDGTEKTKECGKREFKEMNKDINGAAVFNQEEVSIFEALKVIESFV